MRDLMLPETDGTDVQVSETQRELISMLVQTLACFGGHGQSEYELKAIMRGCKIAMEGFDPQAIKAALKHLTLNNPRNPFRFTPQDLHREIQRQQRKFQVAEFEDDDAVLDRLLRERQALEAERFGHVKRL